MISFPHLNKLTLFVIFFVVLIFSSVFGEDEPSDIWEKKEKQEKQITNEGKTKIKSPILSDDVNKITIKIDEQKINNSEQTVIGIFDPEDNNFSLNMWLESDGKDIKNILKRINKLKLSKLSENLLFQVLFTNAHPPKTNLTASEFLKIKIVTNEGIK